MDEPDLAIGGRDCVALVVEHTRQHHHATGARAPGQRRRARDQRVRADVREHEVEARVVDRVDVAGADLQPRLETVGDRVLVGRRRRFGIVVDREELGPREQTRGDQREDAGAAAEIEHPPWRRSGRTRNDCHAIEAQLRGLVQTGAEGASGVEHQLHRGITVLAW